LHGSFLLFLAILPLSFPGICGLYPCDCACSGSGGLFWGNCPTALTNMKKWQKKVKRTVKKKQREYIGCNNILYYGPKGVLFIQQLGDIFLLCQGQHH
jgi:hypothetical protein